MNDPQVIRFTNEVVRPMSERFRDLRDDINNALATWHGGIGAAVTAASLEDIEDGRENQGVSRLTGNDVVLTMALVTSAADLLSGRAVDRGADEIGVAAVIAKPCVRSMRGA